MKVSCIISVCVVMMINLDQTQPAPAVRDSKNLIFIPANRYPTIYPVPTSNIPNQQFRGPFDWIGDAFGSWIQSSEWFPVEINVPDSFSSVGQFAQNVGNGFNSFTQNVGNGFQNIAQNIGSGVRNLTQRIPIFNNFNRPPTRYFVLLPVQNNQKSIGPSQQLQFDPFTNDFPEFP